VSTCDPRWSTGIPVIGHRGLGFQANATARKEGLGCAAMRALRVVCGSDDNFML